MDFDPDAYLKGDTFDPDEYLKSESEVKKLGKAAANAGMAVAGAVEAPLRMVAGLPAQVIGGLSGLGQLMAGQGIDNASKAVEQVENSDFNKWLTTPTTETGKRYTENLGKVFSAPGEYAGEAGAAIGKAIDPKYEELGRLTGKLPVDAAMNFLPLKVPAVVKKGVSAFERPGKKKFSGDPFDDLGQQKAGSDAEAIAAQPKGVIQKSGFEYIDEPTLEHPIAAQNRVNAQNMTLRNADDWNSMDHAANAVQEEVNAGNAADLQAKREHDAAMGKAFEEAQAARREAESAAISVRMAKTDAEAVAAGERQRQAQQVLEERQRALEQLTAQRQSLDFNAAERARQGQAPVTSPEMMRDLEAKNASEIQSSIDKTQELNTRGQQMNIVEDFGNNDPMSRMPEMRVDENGMPIRADLSMEAQNLQNPLQRNLWGDELGPALDQGRSLTDAIDSMQPSHARDMALSQLTGQEPARSTIMNRDFWSNKQRGTVDFKGVADAFSKKVEELANALSKVNYNRLAGGEQRDALAKLVPETKDLLPQPKSWADVRNEAVGGKPLPDFGNFRTATLSGAELTGEMYKNAATKWTSQWTQWAQKIGERASKLQVRPLEHKFYQLRNNDLINVANALKAESKHGVRFTPEELSSNGVSGKALEAYTELRRQLDDVYEKQAQGHRDLGLEPPTKEEAYAASLRHGDYHLAVTDKNGRPIWYSRFESRVGANKALAWLKQNVKNADIDWNSIKVENRASNLVRSIPRDVLAEYQEIARMVDPEAPASKAIQEAIKQAQEDRGYTYQGQDKRFMKKTGVPGFEGDMPWLSEKENATRLIRAQLDYLNTSNRWIPMQKALGELKQMFADPDFNNNHASTAAYTRGVVDHVLGINPDPVRVAERYLSNKLGLGQGRIAQATSSLKAFNALQKLSGSAGFIISTPLQALNGVGLLSREVGLGAVHPVTNLQALGDIAAMLANDSAKGTVGKVTENYPKLPMTKLGEFATRYMEANNTSRSIVDQHHELGSNPVMNLGKSVLGASVSIPEAVARKSTLMAFAHHLAAKGYAGGDMLQIMQRAESLANMVNTNYMRGELPQAFSMAGSISSMWGQFKAPAFNFYNQLHGLSRDAVDGVKTKQFGKVAPVLALLAATTYLAGLKNLPGVQEMDGGWNLAKEGIAELMPEHYSKVMGLGLRNFITNNAGEAAANGIVSHITGASMGSRFSPNVLDVEHPFKNLLPALGPEMAEWGGLAKSMSDPTNLKNWQQFGYSALANPMAKGLMETHLDNFKAPYPNQDGLTNYRKASDIKNPQVDYRRTPEEESLRKLGLRSIKETDTREQRYAVTQERERISTAYDNLVKSMASAMLEGDKNTANQKTRAALALIPDRALLNKSVDTYVKMGALTPEQREIAKAQNMRNLQMYLARQGKSLNAGN